MKPRKPFIFFAVAFLCKLTFVTLVFWVPAHAQRSFHAVEPVIIGQAHSNVSTAGNDQSQATAPASTGAANNWRRGRWSRQHQGPLARYAQQFIESRQNAPAQWSGTEKVQLRELSIDGVTRRYYLYKPASATKPAPLVLAFHGGGGKAEGTDKCAGGMAKVADRRGFVVAYPDAMDKHWNDGRKDLAKTNYNDVEFISKVIDDLAAEKVIDPKRVYATGISNGGFFSQYLAISLPDKIAAVASVAASVPTSFQNLKVSSPIPMLMLLGTQDPLVPWQGGKIGGKLLPSGRGQVVSEKDSLAFWLTQNQNSNKAAITQLPDTDPADKSRVEIQQFGAPGSSNEVVVYEIHGGGHTWPQGQQYLPQSIIGPVCKDFNGNEVIWSFFARHSRQ